MQIISFIIDGLTIKNFRYSYLEDENSTILAYNMEQLSVS